MANEIRLTVSVQITKGGLDFQSRPTAYTLDMIGAKGPTPGALTIPVGGKVIPFSELTTPGLCWMVNLDEDNYVEYGIWDQQTDVFYPLGELPPDGKPQIIYLSRNILEEYTGTGTGTTGPSNAFFMKANTADCNVIIAAFEK